MHIIYKYFTVIGLALISLSITLGSCKKKEEVDNETQSVVDNAICEQHFMSVAPTLFLKATGSPKHNGFRVATCGQGTWILVGNDTTTSHFQNDTVINISGRYVNGPVNFIIDYNQTSGCPDVDNITKLGKIKIKSSHKWSAITTQTINTVATATITYVNYVADGITYNGIVTLTRTTNGTIHTIRTQVAGGNCTKDGWNIYYTCDKSIEQNSNGDALITGSSTGINRDGRSFSASVTTPLFKPFNYKYITSGQLDITPDKLKARTVNFGNGTLDNKATFSVGGQIFEFTLQ